VEVGDISILTSFSIDGEHSLNTSSEATQSLSKVLRVDSNGWGTGKSVQTILVAVFLGFLLSSPISSPADQHRIRCPLGNDARWRSWRREVVWVVRSSFSEIRQREKEDERESPSSLAEVV